MSYHSQEDRKTGLLSKESSRISGICRDVPLGTAPVPAVLSSRSPNLPHHPMWHWALPQTFRAERSDCSCSKPTAKRESASQHVTRMSENIHIVHVAIPSVILLNLHIYIRTTQRHTLKSSCVTARESNTSASMLSSSRSIRSIFPRICWSAASEHRAARSAPTWPCVSAATYQTLGGCVDDRLKTQSTKWMFHNDRCFVTCSKSTSSASFMFLVWILSISRRPVASGIPMSTSLSNRPAKAKQNVSPIVRFFFFFFLFFLNNEHESADFIQALCALFVLFFWWCCNSTSSVKVMINIYPWHSSENKGGKYIPKRLKAASTLFGLLVAAMTITWDLCFNPSISVSSCDTMRLSTSPCVFSLFGAMASSSSMKMIAGEFFSASSKAFRRLLSDSPASLLIISGPLIRKKKAPVSLATALAISVFPVPGGP